MIEAGNSAISPTVEERENAMHRRLYRREPTLPPVLSLSLSLSVFVEVPLSERLVGQKRSLLP